MTTFKQFLINEARKNPEQNPKISPFHQLRAIADKYGTDNIFVRYSGVNKLGANPQSKWGTPLGICAYPLKYVLDSHGIVPYAGQMPYMIVFKVKDDANIWDVSSDNVKYNNNILQSISTYFNSFQLISS